MPNVPPQERYPENALAKEKRLFSSRILVWALTGIVIVAFRSAPQVRRWYKFLRLINTPPPEQFFVNS